MVNEFSPISGAPETPITPGTYGLGGNPAAEAEVRRLMGDLEGRTLRETSPRLITGRRLVVRTMGLVYDADAAGGVTRSGYERLIWGTALYSPPSENRLIEVVCQYCRRQTALAAHDAAITNIALGDDGQLDPHGRPVGLSDLSWAGSQ